jgi:hypothetical protein
MKPGRFFDACDIFNIFIKPVFHKPFYGKNFVSGSENFDNIVFIKFFDKFFGTFTDFRDEIFIVFTVIFV